jgi:tetratricopeptide (TPR) repeat protein
MRGLLVSTSMRLMGTLLLCEAAATFAAAPAYAQGSYSPYNESAAAALARYVRTLASDPKDFGSLIGAGRSALALGDAQAAAGFFARADEVNPRSPLPQAGMGAVSVANGEPAAALPYFARAQQLGAPVTTFAVDRGLAYDLMGQQKQAQADYQLAINGPDADEARRRLALSLAISGDRAGALEAIAPLSARGDAACGRVRAFILALTGDSNGAMVAIDKAMPGSWASVSPFLQRLPGLQAGQKAAAVNFGIFPDSGSTAYAYAAPVPNRPTAPLTLSINANGDRLTTIDDLLRAPPPPPAVKTFATKPRATQVAYAAPQKSQTALAQRAASVTGSNKIWLQLASGSNADALSGEFRRMKKRNSDLFEGIRGYVARSADRARLVIGPFRGSSDAEIFAEDLQTVGIDAFKWSNSQADRIVPLATE